MNVQEIMMVYDRFASVTDSEQANAIEAIRKLSAKERKELATRLDMSFTYNRTKDKIALLVRVFSDRRGMFLRSEY